MYRPVFLVYVPISKARMFLEEDHMFYSVAITAMIGALIGVNMYTDAKDTSRSTMVYLFITAFIMVVGSGIYRTYIGEEIPFGSVVIIAAVAIATKSTCKRLFG